MSDCIIWHKVINNCGYGMNGKGLLHRQEWENINGPIPKGKEIHHTCEVRACYNVEHLRLVTRRENIMMSDNFASRNAKKTKCPQGHKYNEANTYTDNKNCRHCRVCNRLSKKISRQKFYNL